MESCFESVESYKRALGVFSEQQEISAGLAKIQKGERLKILYLKVLKEIFRATRKLDTHHAGNKMGETIRTLTNPANGSMIRAACSVHIEMKQDLSIRGDKTVCTHPHAT